MTKEERKEYDRKRYLKKLEEKKKPVSKSTEYRRKRSKEDPEYAERLKEKYKSRYNTEEYRAKRRAAYAAKHANEPMSKHRQACIDSAKKRLQIPIDERARYRQIQAEELALKPKEKPGRKKSKVTELTFEDRVDMLMQQFRLHATGKVRGKAQMVLSHADETYYKKRVLLYDELGERLEKLDPVQQYSERNGISWKRNAIRKDFEELLQKKYTFVERML